MGLGVTVSGGWWCARAQGGAASPDSSQESYFGSVEGEQDGEEVSTGYTSPRFAGVVVNANANDSASHAAVGPGNPLLTVSASLHTVVLNTP